MFLWFPFLNGLLVWSYFLLCRHRTYVLFGRQLQSLRCIHVQLNSRDIGDVRWCSRGPSSPRAFWSRLGVSRHLQPCLPHWGNLQLEILPLCEKNLQHTARVWSCNRYFICVQTGNCTKAPNFTIGLKINRLWVKRWLLIFPLLLPLFGLHINRSFKALMILCHQVWLHPSLLTFTMIWDILSAGEETESKVTYNA